MLMEQAAQGTVAPILPLHFKHPMNFEFITFFSMATRTLFIIAVNNYDHIPTVGG